MDYLIRHPCCFLSPSSFWKPQLIAYVYICMLKLLCSKDMICFIIKSYFMLAVCNNNNNNNKFHLPMFQQHESFCYDLICFFLQNYRDFHYILLSPLSACLHCNYIHFCGLLIVGTLTIPIQHCIHHSFLIS